MPSKESPSYPKNSTSARLLQKKKHPTFTNTCSATCTKCALASIHNPFCLLSVNIQENNV